MYFLNAQFAHFRVLKVAELQKGIVWTILNLKMIIFQENNNFKSSLEKKTIDCLKGFKIFSRDNGKDLIFCTLELIEQASIT